MITIYKSLIIFFISCILTIPCLKAEVRYHSESDKEKATRLIEAAKGDSYGKRIVSAAKSLIGVPFGKAADNDSVGTIMVRLDSISQRDFIYLCLAAAKTADLSVPTLKDFEKYLENISRKKGTDEGFVSQFFYASDWIVDNVNRGNIKEMTEYLDGGSFRTKTLDYVSRHPEEFPAMSNPETADKIRLYEFGLRSHRIPHLKKQSISNKRVKELLQEGDIIIMSPGDSDFDIYDIGIVTFENSEPTLLHISREEGKVVMDPYPLPRLFKNENQFFYGYRWLRPSE